MFVLVFSIVSNDIAGKISEFQHDTEIGWHNENNGNTFVNLGKHKRQQYGEEAESIRQDDLRMATEG